MELFAYFIMFNAVSRSIACVSVPQTNHKYPYVIDFKMACLIVRKYYRLYNNKPPDEMFVEMLAYTVPVYLNDIAILQDRLRNLLGDRELAGRFVIYQGHDKCIEQKGCKVVCTNNWDIDFENFQNYVEKL